MTDCPLAQRAPNQAEPAPTSKRLRAALLLAVPVLAAAIWAYHSQIRHPFVIDDWRYLASIQSGSWRHDVTTPSASVFRPVLNMWFVVGYALVGLHASAFGAAAFLVLAANATLLAWLVRQWNLSWVGAVVAAGVYALHPALAGAVNWVAASNALVVATFALLACCFLADPRPAVWRWFVAALLIGLALLTREDAVVMVIAVPVLRFTLPDIRPLRPIARVTAALIPVVPLIVVAAGYAAVRLGVGASTEGTAYQTSVGSNVLRNAVRLAEYLAAIPLLATDAQIGRHHWQAFGIAFAAVIAGLAVILWRRQPLAAAGAVFCFLGTVPALILSSHAMEPYYLDLAIPGLALSAAAISDEIPRWIRLRSPTAIGLAALILLAGTAALANHINVLQNKRSLLTVYRARQETMLRQLPATIPRDAVICLAGGSPRDAAIAVSGDLFRATRHDDHLGLLLPPQPGSKSVISYGAGFTSLTGRPIIEIQLQKSALNGAAACRI